MWKGLPHSLALEAAGAALVVAAVAWVAYHANFRVGFSVALAGSLLTSHHSYPPDSLLLLPALLTLAAEVPRNSLRFLCLMLLSPLPFLVAPVIPLASPVPILLLALLTVLVTTARRPEPIPALLQ